MHSNSTPDLRNAQLFLDDRWIEEANYLSRQWHSPTKIVDPVIKPDRPWERWCVAAYGTILRWRGKFRAWYVPFNRPSMFPRRGVCYAESDDGVAWEKPNLGLCEQLGTRENNLVMNASASERFMDDISVIDDPADAEWPLKALVWEGETHDWSKNDWGIYAARSKDGIHWDRTPGLVLPQWIDRFNAVATRVNGKYILFGRTTDVTKSMSRNGRSVWRIESDDFVRWSAPQLVLERDAEDPLHLQYYSLVAFPYEGILLGGLERMHMSPDRLDTELLWSDDDGKSWKRSRTREAFLAPTTAGGRRWDDTWTNLPTNAPIRNEGRLWFYYTGRSAAHTWPYPTNHGAIGLSLLRVDGFASIRAGAQGGTMLTKPIQAWPANAALAINAEARGDLTTHPGYCTGEIRVEARDAENRPIDGFTFADCTPIGQTLNEPDSCAPVSWKGGRSMRELAGKTVRLAFQMRDAYLYSFRART